MTRTFFSRSLNDHINQLAVFSVALGAGEIKKLDRQATPHEPADDPVRTF